jgi:hypothetical protein
MQERRNVSVNLRLRPPMHAELERMAKQDDRTVANLIRHILREAIERDYADRGEAPPDLAESRPE